MSALPVHSIDQAVHAAMARLSGGLSPAALGKAYMDWALHLSTSPGKQLELAEKAWRKAFRLASFATRCAASSSAEPCIVPLPQDRRFAAPEWQEFPYNLIYQSFLLTQQWWHNATTDVRGVTRHHENMVEFTARQLLDMVSPANFPLTNPVVQKRTLETGGHNFINGARNFIEDAERSARGVPPAGADRFVVGRDLATAPGAVVYRNRLIEVIQYAPTTAQVRPEPILIVPAWIMKYYILDLSPHNSLIRYLTDQGFTVFIVSWKNPTAEDRNLSMGDYLRLGLGAALDTVSAITQAPKIHAVGYCLGGTLLAIGAAAMARDGDNRLASLTLLAAQTDFTEAGELTLFINESQVSFLEDMMKETGFLDTRQMAGAFQLLRSNDLIWSRLVRNYMMGEREEMNDLMAWNADATRMPARMHSEYLRHLFLYNDLSEGRYRVADRPVALSDIRAPIFAVGTETDHVAPWRSVFKLHLFADTEVTFVLTSGGHNAGIVSEPGRKHRHYRMFTRAVDGQYVDPETFVATTPPREGSWWTAWAAWLAARSGKPCPPPPLGGPSFPPIAPAPGSYVLQP